MIITGGLVPRVNVIIPDGVLLSLNSSILGRMIASVTAVMKLQQYQEN